MNEENFIQKDNSNQPKNDATGQNRLANDMTEQNQPANDMVGQNQPTNDIAGQNQPSNDVASQHLSMSDTKNLPTNKNRQNKGLLVGLTAAFVVAAVAVAGVLVVNFSSQNKSDSSETNASDNVSDTATDEDANEEVVADAIENITSGTVTTTIDNKTVTYTAAYVIDGVTVTLNSGTYASTADDENVFLVINGGKLVINGDVKIVKSGSADFQGRGDNYSFYGTNSAIAVVGAGSEATINGATISTEVSGANAIVATNAGAVSISDSTINTTKDNSRGLHATYQGSITADAVKISTLGGSSATLATDRGEGTVTATDMTLSTAGAGSPLIYSTGNITVTDSEGTATGAQIAVVEGKNSVTLTDCDFSTYGVGNRNNVDNAAVMIYQSMSGDAGVGTGSFSASDCTLSVLSDSPIYASVPFFFVTNTNAVISLTDVEANFAEAAPFISAIGTSEWGRSGSNGGKVTITASDLTATNTNVNVDSISSVTGL